MRGMFHNIVSSTRWINENNGTLEEQRGRGLVGRPSRSPRAASLGAPTHPRRYVSGAYRLRERSTEPGFRPHINATRSKIGAVVTAGARKGHRSPPLAVDALAGPAPKQQALAHHGEPAREFERRIAMMGIRRANAGLMGASETVALARTMQAPKRPFLHRELCSLG